MGTFEVCCTAAGADSQTGTLSVYLNYPFFKLCSLSSGINLFFFWPILAILPIINAICHGIYSKFMLWQLSCVLVLNYFFFALIDLEGSYCSFWVCLLPIQDSISK